MIKQIKKFQIKLTPFDATKEWSMSTTNNQDLLLMDNTSSLDNEPVALEFIDYGNITSSHPQLNFECDIALEQQPDDLINTRMGLNVSGLFYPDTDPINQDKTYKRTVFSQVRTMFYNRFHDPTKIWGMDQLDFALGKTKRKISDEIRLFDFPQQVYGDRIIPNTIVIHDNSLDVDYEITDDGFGNLVAGNNLFSRQQEVSKHDNWYQDGFSSGCNSYFSFDPPGTPTLSGNVLATSFSAGTSSLSWNITSLSIDGFFLQRSFDNITYTTLAVLGGNTTTYLDYPISTSVDYFYRVNAFNQYGTSSYSNVVDLFFLGLVSDPFNEYSLGRTSNFASGTNWVVPWSMDSSVRLIASESFNLYALNTTYSINANLNKDFGWAYAWSTASSVLYLAASESWDEYTLGQSSSFNQGYGLTLKWINTSGSI